MLNSATIAKMVGAEGWPIARLAQQLLQRKGIRLLSYRNHARCDETAASQRRDSNVTSLSVVCPVAAIQKMNPVNEAIAD